MSSSNVVRSAGRPRTFAKDDALDVALELFWQNGYRATTTRDLEAALGLGQSSLYNAFGSKQALLAAALDRYETRISRDVLAPLESGNEGLGAIDSFFAALGRWVTREGRRGCMLINMMAEDGGATDEIARRTRGYRRRVRRSFVLAIERAVERGEVMDGDAAERADLLLGVVLGLNIAARGGASTAELQRLIAGARAQVARWRPA